MSPLPRLSLSSLGMVTERVSRPRYDPEKIRVGHVHLGLGAFFKAHIASFTDDILESDPRWGISAASLVHPAAPNKMREQDFLYTLKEGESYRVLSSVRQTLFGPEDRQTLFSAIADPKVHVISITVTEKGYALGRADISSDKTKYERDDGTPGSLLGYLGFGLRLRRQRRAGPLAILSCDNLPSNGESLKSLLHAFLEGDAESRYWVKDQVSFPNTMVDRIVPASSGGLEEQVAAACGVTDKCAVATEPFRQWVIEDRFAGPRPPWEMAGAEFVSDVAPFERMKLRLLNGSHSALAYLGLLSGWDTLDQAFADTGIRAHVNSLMNEAASTLDFKRHYDLDAYQRKLGERFSNPALRYPLTQIATDGSQKIPHRWLAPALELLKRGEEALSYARVLAAWIRCWQSVPEKMSDPLGKSIEDRVRAPDAVRSVLGLSEIFPPELFDYPAFAANVRRFMGH